MKLIIVEILIAAVLVAVVGKPTRMKEERGVRNAASQMLFPVYYATRLDAEENAPISRYTFPAEVFLKGWLQKYLGRAKTMKNGIESLNDSIENVKRAYDELKAKKLLTTTPSPVSTTVMPLIPTTRGSVSSEEFDIRLIGENGVSTTNGRLEIFYGGQWGTVCDDLLESEAKQDVTGDVICRQLGHFNGGMVTRLIGMNHGWSMMASNDVPIWLTNIVCQGDESNLYDCLYKYDGEVEYRDPCTHREDIWVDCD